MSQDAVKKVFVHEWNLLRLIASFLPSVADVYQLFSVSKSICFCTVEEKNARILMLRQILLANLVRSLEPFGIPMSAFVTAMRSERLSVSGGFALGCITGTPVVTQSSDIDIYCYAGFQPRNTMSALLTTCGYIHMITTSEMPTETNDYATYLENHGIKFIVVTLKHVASERRIQLITVIYRNESPSLQSNVAVTSRHLDNFDLTPCCVNLSVSPHSGDMQWRVPYLSDIIAGVQGPTPQCLEMANIPFTRKHLLTLRRILKYAGRGYRPTVELHGIFATAVGLAFEERNDSLRKWFAGLS